MFDLSDKVALVTGASRGIGASIATTLGQAGATVVGTATTQAGADKITAALKAANIEGFGVALDVTNADAIAPVLKEIAERYQAPDILVNNAGITRDNLFLRMKDEEWDAVIDANLTGVYRMAKACIRGMVKARWGRIVNISSVSGFAGNPGQANYAATKAGVVGFTKALAHEVASRKITVNCVAPGFIATDMTSSIADEHADTLLKSIPAGRMGASDEIAAGVLYLASNEAAYVTGETLHVNGGMYMN